MLDGRHTGTGGGNHIVVGGSTPADSPFLRRPDLLPQPRRVLAQPPGAVIPVQRPVRRADQPGPAHRRGPQRPVAELEIAFAQIPEYGDVPPWIVDRNLRNILVDSTGTRTGPSSASISSTHPSRVRVGWVYWKARVRDAAARAD